MRLRCCCQPPATRIDCSYLRIRIISESMPFTRRQLSCLYLWYLVVWSTSCSRPNMCRISTKALRRCIVYEVYRVTPDSALWIGPLLCNSSTRRVDSKRPNCQKRCRTTQSTTRPGDPSPGIIQIVPGGTARAGDLVSGLSSFP